MKRITLGTLMLCPALLSAQPTEFPPMSSMLSSPNSAHATAGSIPGALCPYVMVDGGAIQYNQPFDVFAYIEGVLTTGVLAPATEGIYGSIAVPLSALSPPDPSSTGPIPLNGAEIIAFEATITGFNDMPNNLSLTPWINFSARKVAGSGDNAIEEIVAQYSILIARLAEEPTATIAVGASFRNYLDKTRGSFLDDSLSGITGNSVTVGLYYNQITRRVGVVTDAFGDYGYIPPTNEGDLTNIHPLQEIDTTTGMFFSFTNVFGPGSQSDAMLTIDHKTNAGDFTLAYPSGTVDICGNEI
ncbi:hypothetical protein [Marinobacter sp. CA1]|uniref:hypothetical protein n=1 Tax=Marinobacter sp. CA1 TaxID=2817656 RepID=UPI001D06C561|nr:hypothetical protein [Marinobacter sp. CA1]UDL04580.1 hypothetical protein J2887_18165 [Marinobacter sp. CA1]